jgi:hypothetical protein
MILLIVSVLLFLGLIAMFVLKSNKKLMILSALVILLVVCNFLNELQAAIEDNVQVASVPDYELPPIEQLVETYLPTLENHTAHSHHQ